MNWPVSLLRLVQSRLRGSVFDRLDFEMDTIPQMTAVPEPSKVVSLMDALRRSVETE